MSSLNLLTRTSCWTGGGVGELHLPLHHHPICQLFPAEMTTSTLRSSFLLNHALALRASTTRANVLLLVPEVKCSTYMNKRIMDRMRQSLSTKSPPPPHKICWIGLWLRHVCLYTVYALHALRMPRCVFTMHRQRAKSSVPLVSLCSTCQREKV